jgi:hypothetical protein
MSYRLSWPGRQYLLRTTSSGLREAGWESLAMVKAIHLGEKTLNKSWSSRLGVCHEASSITQENYLLKKLNKEMLDR